MDSGRVKVRILEGGSPTAARVHLLDSAGTWRYPPGSLAYEKDWHSTVEGGFEMQLPPGTTRLRIEKGKEYKTISDEFVLEAGSRVEMNYDMERWIDMNEMGWFSGDTHVHRLPADMGHLLEAEDLNVAPVLSFWNQMDGPREIFDWHEYGQRVISTGRRAFGLLSQEDERAAGAVMALNIQEPVVSKTTKWYPSQAFFAEKWRDQGGVVEQEKPFWWEAPVNVALGLADSMGIVNNHLQRTEVMDNEAWGRGRDRRTYPGPRGFILNVLDLYYRYLNLGIKLPIAAGSASGVLRNPLGYNRLYVRLKEEFSYEGWFRGMLSGATFATNGPMLFMKIDGEIPSLTVKRSTPMEFCIDVEARTQGQLETIEIVVNGKVEEAFDCGGNCAGSGALNLEPESSCWVAARAFELAPGNVRLAHTSPVFLEVPDPVTPSKTDARYYADWCQELLEASRKDPGRYPSDEARGAVEGYYTRATEFYDRLASR
jgi:hypothetical protein